MVINQRDNIQDCIKNGHRVGRTKQLIVYDKIENKTIVCSPAINILKYINRTAVNGCINNILKRQWFTNQFDIVEFKQVESVTTKPDEFKVVDGRLTPVEVHRQQ